MPSSYTVSSVLHHEISTVSCAWCKASFANIPSGKIGSHIERVTMNHGYPGQVGTARLLRATELGHTNSEPSILAATAIQIDRR
ncbi:MAG: hypothetical protein SVW57_01630 [Thermodesulfobacteriota bacterium]|nr:hypothetical protein [Thermodesulfobacteriota bacterium]